jgi:hypothetical protein
MNYLTNKSLVLGWPIAYALAFDPVQNHFYFTFKKALSNE